MKYQFGGWVGKNPTLYPTIQSGTAGLPQKSVALCVKYALLIRIEL